MFNTYSDEAMRKINSILGAGHRVKPYNLTNTDDLKQVLLVTVAAYRDYSQYRISLNGLAESYDESLEYCETAAWLDLGQAPEKVDSLIVEGYAVLNAAEDVFNKLAERAKENCAKVVKAVLSAPPAAQTAVFGCEYKIKPHEMDTRINELFEMLGEAEYHQAMPKNLETFLEVMKEVWQPYI